MIAFPEWARQLLHPSAFRIANPPMVSDFADIVRAIREIAEPPQQPNSLDVALVASLATRIWALRRRMLGEGGAPLPEYRRAYPALREAWRALEEAGVQIISHDGLAYDPGLSLEVQNFQPQPGLEGERIIQTVAPTIIWSGARVQQGVVVVGIPDSSDQV
jgi:hypothetical protein